MLLISLIVPLSFLSRVASQSSFKIVLNGITMKPGWLNISKYADINLHNFLFHLYERQFIKWQHCDVFSSSSSVTASCSRCGPSVIGWSFSYLISFSWCRVQQPATGGKTTPLQLRQGDEAQSRQGRQEPSSSSSTEVSWSLSIRKDFLLAKIIIHLIFVFVLLSSQNSCCHFRSYNRKVRRGGLCN